MSVKHHKRLHILGEEIQDSFWLRAEIAAAGNVKRVVLSVDFKFFCIGLSNSVLVRNFHRYKMVKLTLLLLAALSSLAYGEFARRLFFHT